LADHDADRSVRRMVLLSDGQANVGEIRPDKLFASAASLRDRGIGLSSIGVGLDFNAQLMQGLAEQGGGRFRFLEDPTEIAQAFAKELRIAATLVAADVRVVLHPADGVRIEDIYGQPFDRVGRDVVVHLTSLASTTRVRVLSRLSVDAFAAEFPVVEVAATYAEVSSDKSRVVTRAPVLTARTTTSAVEANQLANREVLTYAINGRGIADASRAMELYEQGKRAEALAALDTAANTVEVGNKDLKSKELKESYGVFGNLRSLFSASANALGSSEDQEARRAVRKDLANFASNNLANE
jgi:Ca-activated chloride channel family protein